LTGTSQPVIPVSGVTYFTKFRAGRTLPNVVGPSGLDYPLQSHFGMNKNAIVYPIGNVAATHSFGILLNTTGTVTAANFATTNFTSSLRRVEYVCGATAGQSVGVRSSVANYWRGNTGSAGGFYAVLRMIPAITATNWRFFAGFASSTAAPVNTDPSTWGFIAGVGKDAADTTYQFMTNWSGTATKTNTGISANQGSLLEIRIFSRPSGSSIGMSCEDITPGAAGTTFADFDSGAIANLPPSSASLCPQIHMNNNATATAIRLALSSIYIETDD
jgi:hypothetical protein